MIHDDTLLFMNEPRGFEEVQAVYTGA